MLELAGPRSFTYYFYLLSSLFAVLTSLALSYLLITRRRHSLLIASFVFSLLSFTLCGLGVLAVNVIRFSEKLYVFAQNMISFGYIMMPVWLFLFAYLYTGQEKKRLRFRLFFFLVGSFFGFLYLAWTTDFLKSHSSASSHMTSWGPQTAFGPLYPFLLVWIAVLMLSSMVMIYKDSRNTFDPLRKLQGMYIVVAMSIPLIIGIITDGVLPLFHIDVFPAAVPLMNVMVLIIGYAILKYGLFELTFENTLALMNLPVITMGSGSEILAMNDRARKLLKLPQNWQSNLLITDVIKDEPEKHHSHENVLRILEKIFRFKKRVNLNDLSFVRSDGSKITVSLAALPILSDDLVHAANLILYPKGSKKTPVFQMDEIISIATHEIKTPLTSIKLITDMLLKAARKRKDVLSCGYLAKMNAQLDVITRLINDFADVSRLERGKLPVHKRKINLRELIENVAETMKSQIGSRKIHIQTDPRSYALVDRERMSQVMTNLITNAIKYSPDGTPIFIRVLKSQHDICIEVEDQGIGIAESEHEKIFRRYYRIKSSAGRVAGMGMGLYIVKKIIDIHDGRITLESSVGKGTIFKIFLPKASA